MGNPFEGSAREIARHEAERAARKERMARLKEAAARDAENPAPVGDVITSDPYEAITENVGKKFNEEEFFATGEVVKKDSGSDEAAA